MSAYNFNSTSNKHLIANAISTSDQRHRSDIDIWCMSVQNLNSTSNRRLIANVISTSDNRHCLELVFGECWFTT